jgi:hypothetical protein
MSEIKHAITAGSLKIIKQYQSQRPSLRRLALTIIVLDLTSGHFFATLGGLG